MVAAALQAAVNGIRARGAAVYAPAAAARPLASVGDTSEGPARVVLPVRAGGEDVGRLELWAAAQPPASDWRFLSGVAALVGAAIERPRFAADAARARDEERARIARELHDGAAQAIGAAKLEVERLAARHPDIAFAQLLERLQGVFADLRALSRALRPPALETLGFRGALRALADDLGRRSEVKATFTEQGTPYPLAPDAEWHLYRIAAEACANVARHAHASRTTIELAYTPGTVRLSVEDDGCGFEPETAGREGAGGIGLFTIRERARALGGRLTIASRPGGGGTRIDIAVSASSKEMDG